MSLRAVYIDIPGMRGTSYGRRLIGLDYPDRESNRLTAAFHFYGTWEPICASDACAERLELSPFSMLKDETILCIERYIISVPFLSRFFAINNPERNPRGAIKINAIAIPREKRKRKGKKERMNRLC